MKKGNIIISHHVKFDHNIFPFKEISPSKQGSLDLLFHDSPDSPSQQSTFLLSHLPSESGMDSMTLSSVETENSPNTSTSIPSAKLPKNKGYSLILNPSTPN
ncbi:hypothetical protein O181_013115 [Austropuccinia psidii MF-1]|uniref:Uncharacterized protein n=1 Tax=Austropuccinia psidii MF-1 TaxID=1389203 RepID=A0A9Q3BZ81_9BASI|nr:hypothetical protein [Austropuccinia psidii MF-1]